MNLCHLYNTNTVSIHREKILKAFSEHISIDISQNQDVNNHYKIYILELEHVNKTLSTKIMKIFETQNNPLIYFIVPQEHSLSLIQLAFLLDTKSIITSHQDTDKVVAKIKKDYTFHTEKLTSVILGQKLVNHHSYMLFKDSKLSFASEQLYRDFGCENLEQVETKICSKLDLTDLFSNETQVKRRIANNILDESTFFIKSVLSDNENMISFEEHSDYEPQCAELSYLSTRMHFVELLKDKLLEKMMSNLSLTLLTIQLKTGQAGLSKLDKETFKKEFLHEVEIIINEKLILAEYDSNSFVILFETIPFDILQEKAKNFHLQISSFLNKQNSKYIVSLHTVNIENTELSPLLYILDCITQDKINKTLLKNANIKYINNFQENMDEIEIINFMLDSVFVNTSDLKLLNIYNGMCINTSSKILRKTKDSIYVKIEHIQGVVMSIDKKTVLQASILAKSIRANVEYINIKEGYAILNNFVILDHNPNVRQHGRVTSSKIIPIAIALPGSIVKGELIDISATSIAIKVKKTKSLRNMLNREIGLTFYLDSKNTLTATQKMSEKATIIHESKDQEGFSKLICLLIENQTNEDILIDYIFSRQKNIIQSMRNLVNI